MVILFGTTYFHVSDPCPLGHNNRLGDHEQFVEFLVFSFGRTGLSDFQDASIFAGQYSSIRMAKFCKKR
jgi:hypothetical protein